MGAPASVDAIRAMLALVQPELARVEASLARLAQTDDAILAPMLSTVLPGSGKRLRPALALLIGRLGALRLRAKPNSQLTASELVARGYLALQRGTMRENLSAAMASFDEALQRDPHYQPALLAVARVHISATMNFVDLDLSPERAAAMLRTCGFTFMFAPNYHPAMRNAAPVRRGLDARHEIAAAVRLGVLVG